MAKVLIVEDEVPIANSYAFLLNKAGFETVMANDGRQGLQCAQTILPDYIILDMLMPGFSGLDMLRQLNPKTTLPNCRIIALSNTEAESVRTQALELGVEAYYLKVEITPHQLLDILTSLGPAPTVSVPTA